MQLIHLPARLLQPLLQLAGQREPALHSPHDFLLLDVSRRFCSYNINRHSYGWLAYAWDHNFCLCLNQRKHPTNPKVAAEITRLFEAQISRQGLFHSCRPILSTTFLFFYFFSIGTPGRRSALRLQSSRLCAFALKYLHPSAFICG